MGEDGPELVGDSAAGADDENDKQAGLDGEGVVGVDSQNDRRDGLGGDGDGNDEVGVKGSAGAALGEVTEEDVDLCGRICSCLWD